MRKLDTVEANRLLTDFCATAVHAAPKIGLECRTRELGPAFGDILDNRFHPETVIYGNYLGPGSEDAAVGGWSAEHHTELWRGTLLVTKRHGRWAPVWYKSTVITHSCRKLNRVDARQVLLCEEEDGGMGHVLHYLFGVDFTKPATVQKSALAVADFYENFCGSQQQRIRSADVERIAMQFARDRRITVSALATRVAQPLRRRIFPTESQEVIRLTLRPC